MSDSTTVSVQSPAGRASRELLERTRSLAERFLEGLSERPVTPQAPLDALRAELARPLADAPQEPMAVIEELARSADAGLVASAGPRYFGFVIGGSVPAALAADWLTSTWDQNAGMYIAGPAASVVEEIAGRWVADLLGLPQDVSFAFVTGTQMAHATALAAARNHVLAEVGWDV